MLTTVFSDRPCRLGEGAAFDPACGTAWWFDILERQLHEADAATGVCTVHALPVMASALGVLDDGQQVIAAEDGVYIRRRADGYMTRLIDMTAPGVSTRSNDGRVHPSGTFWFSTMGRAAEPGAGAIHVLHRGALQTLFSRLTIPNAICFSADGTLGYFADSTTNLLHRVMLDPLTGLPSGDPAVFLQAVGSGVLDGAVIDAAGLIWCARWGGGRFDVYSPGAALVRSLALPVLQPTCPVFIGRNRDRLLVTSAYEGLPAAARAANPLHGCTFLMEGTGASGLPEPRVRLH